MIYEIEDRSLVEELFGGWEETILWSCLQGVMGHIYADDSSVPASAMALLGDFCFYAGKPNMEMAAFRPDWCHQDFIIGIPRSRPWARVLEQCYGDRAKKVTRYAMKKEQDIFDIDGLNRVVSGLSAEYEIKCIDEPLFTVCRNTVWSRDLVSQFDHWQMYQGLGLGVVITKEGEVVSGASSYSAYRGGIEIEIDTKPEYRRRGLALVCGARLILECLDRGWYPSWDAANTGSVALAEKLGYHLDYEYAAYEIYGYGEGKYRFCPR